MLVKEKAYETFEAMQLTWANWSNMCLFVGIGEINKGKPQGCYILPDGTIMDKFGGDNCKIGLKIPNNESKNDHSFTIASQGDWIVKNSKGEMAVFTADEFEQTYEPVGQDWNQYLHAKYFDPQVH